MARARSSGRGGALALGPGRFHRDPLDRRALPRLHAGWARRRGSGARREGRRVAPDVQSARRGLERRRSPRGGGARRGAAGRTPRRRHLELQRLRTVDSRVARVDRPSRLRRGLGRGGRGEARPSDLRAVAGARGCRAGRGRLHRGSLLHRRARRPRRGHARGPARPRGPLGLSRLPHGSRPSRRRPRGARVAVSRLLGALVLALVVFGCAAASARGELDATLREAVHSVPVTGTDSSIVVTSFRPPGKGPFPWIALSHGTATTAAANRAIGRYRPLPPIREWVQRGYAVVVPVRRGYGASGGEHFGDAYGGCARPDFRRAGEGATLDLLATVAWAKTEPDLDGKRWLLVGQSAGAFASIYTAAKHPDGLVAVLAFAPGRGGDPEKRPGEPCASDRMAELFAAIAPQVRVPVLWFYAENDQ